MRASLSSVKIYGEIMTFYFFFFVYFQHVHIHVLPRKAGDFHRNDSIYDEVGLLSLILLCALRGCPCDESSLSRYFHIYGLEWDSTQYDLGSSSRGEVAQSDHYGN